MAKKWLNTPGWWNEGKKITINEDVKNAIAAILDRDAVKSLRNELAKHIRKLISKNSWMMKKIDLEWLQYKLLEVYYKWNFNLTEEEANALAAEKAERFIKIRDDMTDEQRKDYVEASIAVHYEETSGKIDKKWERKVFKKHGL